MDEIARLAKERDTFMTALLKLTDPPPSMKGMPPKDKTNRLRNVIMDRAIIAREALKSCGYL